MATAPLQQAPARAKLTSGLTSWLLFQFTLLGGIVGWQLLAGDSLRLLWTDPLGVKMLTTANVLIALNFAVQFGAGLLLEHFVPERGRGWARIAQFALCAVCFLFLFLPTVFVLLVGPAAVSIQRTMTG